MVLVTGATGNLGSHLTLKLLENNDKIICLYRNENKINNLKRTFSIKTPNSEELLKRIIWRKADLTNPAEVENAFEEVDYVYHCAALLAFNNKKYQQAFEVNVRGTENVVNMALKYNVKKFLHVSSISAIGKNIGGMKTENDFFNPALKNSVYAKTKYYGEMRVWQGIEEGLNAVIVNPSNILAPYKFNKGIKKAIRYLKNNGIKHYTSGLKAYVYIDDLVNIMIKLMNSDILSERFIVSAENIKFKEIIDIINLYWNHPPCSKEINKYSFKPFRILASLAFLGRELSSKQVLYYLLDNDAYSNEKIKKAIDHEFKPINESIVNLLKLYEKKYCI